MATSSFPFPRRSPVRTSFSIGATTLILFAFVPAIAIVVVSFTNLKGIPNLPVEWIGIDNYLRYFSPARRPDNMNALQNTLVFAALATIFQIGIGLAVAILLNRPLKGRNFYRSVVFMPTVLGVTVTALIWSLMFNTSGGPIQGILNAFGTDSAFFGDSSIALYLVIFCQVWMNLGVTVIIFLSGLQAIPADLYEVSSIDGANAWQKFRFVTLPMLAPSITANVLLGIVNAMQSYQLTYVLTGQSNRATQLLSLQVYEQAFGSAQGKQMPGATQGYAAAISMIQFVIVGVIAFGTLWYLRRREAKL
ncbi:sugar ABC transporter permease [Rarobacter faecitabidus]|uniref:Carbohydrate ABC transporter membrane protein 1 (CUT1 family) n=1 Tax=Rarobacter faecitabidus TaxID=13243 RepID=A0A542ZAR4_RARFA|nr:sugar ABC transporter permease [Rarobacter faecitabidus]TQL57415.1 carbohydrate ABC transporter membrane protein 1 (CUT1 family) [Rarobacter faecitabidus]